MNAIIWLTLGYVIHDALQPTAVGEVLDKISLPADLLVGENKDASSV